MQGQFSTITIEAAYTRGPRRTFGEHLHLMCPSERYRASVPAQLNKRHAADQKLTSITLPVMAKNMVRAPSWPYVFAEAITP